jgi:polysaccharide biosynthesis transport protein
MGQLLERNPPPAPTVFTSPEYDNHPDQPVDLRWLWAVLKKHKPLLGLAVVCTVLPTAVFTFLVKPLYLSTVTIQIDPESAKVLPYKDVSESVGNALPDFELYMKTQDELLRSSTLASRTINRLKQQFVRKGLSDSQTEFSSALQVKRIQGSQMIRVSYVSSEPDFAAAVANTLAEEFIKLHFERKYETTGKAAEFLENQLRILKKKVEKAEGDLIEYARNHQILNTDNKLENVIRQRFGYLTTEVSKAEKDFIAQEAEYEGLMEVSPEEFPESLKSPVIASLETRVFQTEQELRKLLTQFDQKWPAVVQKKDELNLVRAQLNQEKQATVARARKDAELKYNAARGQYRMLNRALKEQELLVNRLNEASIQYNTLKRDRDASEQLYQGLLQRLKETGVSAGLEFGNIHIADPAKPEYVPHRPRKIWNLSLALLLGLSSGIVLAFLREHLDNTLKDPWDVEPLGVPLLGWIPLIKGPNHGSRRLGTGQASLATLFPERRSPILGSILSTAEWRTRESYRALCARILLSKAEHAPRTILITSALPREGKTTTSAFLGTTLADTGAHTLLIDADFRNPTLSRLFGISTPEGLSVFLAGGKLDVRQTSTANLFVLPSGPTPPNPVALFSAERFSETLEALTKRFRFILIDSPPLLSLADASLLASKVDGVILVVQAGKTPRDILRKASVQLHRAGAYILGAAVNQVDLQSAEYSHYRKYYYDPKYRDGTTS